MSTAPDTPDLADTSERQAALRRYHVLDTAPEKKFDRITSMIAKICDVPTALITLIDEERQWFKSCFGFDQRETDLDISFCVYAVDAGEMLVVEDATKDPRFKDNPIVTGPPHLRFYAGAPLTTPDGVHIGTLCIIDYETRTFDAAQREILEDLADTVVAQFELRSAEAQIQQLVDKNPQPMYVYAETDGRILRANAAADEQYGYDLADGAPRTVDDLTAPPDVQPAADTLSIHEHADGSPIPVRLRERDILFDGHEARLAVPQRLHDPDTEIAFQADLDGTVQSLSPNWTDVTGVPVEKAVGHTLPDLVLPADRAATEAALDALRTGTAPRQHIATFYTEDGQQAFTLELRRVETGEQSTAGLVGTLAPVSSPAANADASAAADAPDGSAPEDDPAPDASPEDDTTNNASPDAAATDSNGPPKPDLPTFDEPGDTVAPPRDDAVSRDGAPNPESAGRAPSVSPHEAPVTSEPFDLADHLRTLVADHADRADQEGLALEASMPDSSLPVRLDPGIVREIVTTLLDNALTHTNAGSIEVEAEVDDDTVHVYVEDTGTGVEERFMQVYMNAGDTAAGESPLHHVHQLTNRIGGAMNMEEGTDGTRFCLTLPRSGSTE